MDGSVPRTRRVVCVPQAEGVWELRGEAGERSLLRAGPAGARLESPDWEIACDGAGGWVARSGGDEVASLLVDPGAAARSLLMADGRLFRIVARDPRSPGWDLAGWETDAAYLSAVPHGAGWEIGSTPAGDAVDGLDDLLRLFAVAVEPDAVLPLSRRAPQPR